VNEKNINYIKLWEKCGFRADGKIKTVDFGEIFTGIRMRRDL
jgi:RimJ/RimL family protein N-acetyltransferase